MHQPLQGPVLASNPIVFLDIKIGSEFVGRMVIELRSDVVPLAAENYRSLCTGERGIGSLGQPLYYKGLRFHKVTRIYVAQSGDVVNNDGTSGESIYGPIFEDENFTLKHEEGVVSMANYGQPHSNNSQFVITSVRCDNLNDTNVVVGKVLRGFGIIGEMEKHASDEGEPTQEILIANCGEIAPGQNWGFNDNDDDDHLPPFPQDWDKKFDALTSDEAIALLTNIRHSGNSFFTKQLYYDARRKYNKANRYCEMLRSRHKWEESKHLEQSDEDLAKMDTFSVVNHVNLAAVELKLGECDSAKRACTEALRIDPKCSKAYYRRGQVHIALKNYEDAIRDLKQAHNLLPHTQILKELNLAKQLLSTYNRKQMVALSSLFK